MASAIKNPKGEIISSWYSHSYPTPGRIERSELNEILDAIVAAGLGNRNVTMLPLQGIVLNNVVTMVTEETSSEYIIMWPSYHLTEEEQSD